MIHDLHLSPDEFTNHVKAGYSKSERYIAFLLSSLPDLVSYHLSGAARETRGAVLATALELIEGGEGLCLEFGVYKGGSITACARRFPQRVFHGFDSFEGFPDDGRPDWNQNFAVVRLPQVPENVQLHKGWFSETLPTFLEQHPGDIDLLHVDCDIYSSAKQVFDLLGQNGRMKPGVLIVFDELLSYRGYLWNEMLAFFEMLEATGLGFRWVCAHDRVRLLEETLETMQSGHYPLWEDDLKSGFRQQAAVMLTNGGVDYSVLRLPHSAQRVRDLAQVFELLSAKRDPKPNDG